MSKHAHARGVWGHALPEKFSVRTIVDLVCVGGHLIDEFKTWTRAVFYQEHQWHQGYVPPLKRFSRIVPPPLQAVSHDDFFDCFCSE